MPKTDYGQMLADIHKQLVSNIKKVTPELAKNINMIATELDGEVETQIQLNDLNIRIKAKAGKTPEMLQLIANKYLLDIDRQQIWTHPTLPINNCLITTTSGVGVFITSDAMESDLAA
ncbi:hypothetical protein [Aquitalea aquatilis]|uniref:hypothetical protein n=1 Tax=Aquitalea aquatilis TaxID=1537400 RepID=UPI0010BD964E|nr:hypothetical protein [Aquitalea aquatilis]